MKPARSVLFTALTTITLTAVTGCISHEETVYRDEPRLAVEFENDTAGRLFYETLSRSPEKGRHSESNTEVNLPIVFKHQQRVVGGENVAFNAAVRQCDTNADSRITEQEARIFSQRP